MEEKMARNWEEQRGKTIFRLRFMRLCLITGKNILILKPTINYWLISINAGFFLGMWATQRKTKCEDYEEECGK